VNRINSDIYILKAFSVDKNEGFRLLIIKYRERLYFHIRKILILHADTDDALQNTFIKVWENLDKFESKSSLFTWLYRIATNEALAIIKKRKREYNLEDADIESLFNNSTEADSWFDGDEGMMKFLSAIKQLPEKQQLVFNMKYFEELKYEEIGEILETSVGSLKASYHLARKKIEDLLKND
jgi:RNA polymerase sigma-70 factor (ECF subfamily)